MLLLRIYIRYRGHLELEKKERKVANTIKSTHWSGKHTVISLQKSYNGRKRNKKVAILLGEFAAYVEQIQRFLSVTSCTWMHKMLPFVWFQQNGYSGKPISYWANRRRCIKDKIGWHLILNALCEKEKDTVHTLMGQLRADAVIPLSLTGALYVRNARLQSASLWCAADVS